MSSYNTHKSVFRDVETEHLKPRTNIHKVLNQEPFGAPHIAHPITRLQPEMIDNILGDGNPATVIAVAAIADIALTVEVLLSVTAGDGNVFACLPLVPPLDIALGPWIAPEKIYFGHQRAFASSR